MKTLKQRALFAKSASERRQEKLEEDDREALDRKLSQLYKKG